MKPVIGITCDLRRKESGQVHELADRYVQAVTQAGGIAVLLPRVDPEQASLLVPHLDGLIVSGGRDIPPKFYGAQPHPTTNTDAAMEERVAFELALVKAMIEAGKPVLGICHGCQLLNVAFGGTLLQDIPSQHPSPLPHRLEGAPWFVEHEVAIAEGSLLWQWLQSPRIVVKSGHHQAIDQLGVGLRVTAQSPDGIVEAIEAADGRLVVGVQWHPEAQLEADHAQKLFAAFLQACRREP